MNGTSGFLGPVSVSSSLFVQDSASFSQKVKMNGKVMMPNLDTIPDINNSYFLLTDSSGNVYTRNASAGFFDPTIPPQLSSCTNETIIQNPTWFKGTNRLFTCPPIKVGIGVVFPDGQLDVNGDAYFSDRIGIGTTGGSSKLQIAGTQTNKIHISGSTVGTGYTFKTGAFGNLGNVLQLRGGGAPTPDGIVISIFDLEERSLVLRNNGNVGIGTTAVPYKLSVEGIIGAREIIVETATWSDYVFDPDYELMSLEEVKEFTNQNCHLPGVPSEDEVISGGVKLGDMNRILLEKVEEMTLHLIDQNETVKEQQKLLEKQQKQIELLMQEMESMKTEGGQ